MTRPEVRAIPKIGTVLNLFALASAVVYCISGYRKQSQIYYKGFFLFYALHLLTGTVGMIMDFKASAMAAAWVLAFEITFANLMILLVSENLGAKKSKTIALLNTCIWAGYLIHHFIF